MNLLYISNAHIWESEAQIVRADHLGDQIFHLLAAAGLANLSRPTVHFYHQCTYTPDLSVRETVGCSCGEEAKTNHSGPHTKAHQNQGTPRYTKAHQTLPARYTKGTPRYTKLCHQGTQGSGHQGTPHHVQTHQGTPRYPWRSWQQFVVQCFSLLHKLCDARLLWSVEVIQR